MITNEAITAAIGQRLWASLSRPLHIFESNKDAPEGQLRPYLLFQHVPVSRTDDTRGGDAPISKGFVQVSVMAELGKGTDPANQMAETIAAGFPYGPPEGKLPVTGGIVEIAKPPDVKDGRIDGPHWRVDVIVSYIAF